MADPHTYANPYGVQLRVEPRPHDEAAILHITNPADRQEAHIVVPFYDLAPLLADAYTTATGKEVMLLDRTSEPDPDGRGVAIDGGEITVHQGRVQVHRDNLPPWELTAHQARAAAAVLATAADVLDREPRPEQVGALAQAMRDTNPTPEALLPIDAWARALLRRLDIHDRTNTDEGRT